MKEHPERESDVEEYLIQRVKEIGGDTRKVKWIGRAKAPDRVVFLPARPAHPSQWVALSECFGDGVELASVKLDPETVWVELKHPATGHLFPNSTHEEAQHREHERMRRMGQYVQVVWSYEQVEELLT